MSNYLGFEPCNEPYYYFVSYNNEDADRVGAITRKLCKNNVPLWYDYGIPYGEKWETIIAQKIASAEAVILFFTKDILLKERSFVKKEYNIATKNFNKKVYVVMLDFIDDNSVPPDKSFWMDDIREKQNIDIFDINDPDMISDTIISAIGMDTENEDKTREEDVLKPAKDTINKTERNTQNPGTELETQSTKEDVERRSDIHFTKGRNEQSSCWKKLRANVCVVTHAGRIRRENEDNYNLNGRLTSTGDLRKGAAFVQSMAQPFHLAVCDGMGVESFGDLASGIAVETVAAHATNVYDSGEDFSFAISNCLDDANSRICAEINARGKRMGATLAAMYAVKGKVYCVNIGDTRIYHYSKGILEQISFNHAHLQTIDNGTNNISDIKRLARYLGIPSEEGYLSPGISVIDDVDNGDIILLCSDGLTDMLNDDEITAILSAGESSQDVASKLIRSALEKGGKDNITVMAAFMEVEETAVYAPIAASMPADSYECSDEDNLVDLYTLSAKQGNAEALKHLGSRYFYGNGVEQNYKKAVECYTISAANGNADAQCALGVCYYKGYGVGISLKKAVEYYTLSAEQGNANAQYYLGNHYYDKLFFSKKNHKKAFEWYYLAAKQGHADAQNQLGLFFFLGYGVKQNFKKSFEWYSLAAKQGHANAQRHIGNFYYTGITVEKDLKKAFEWYTLAAENGDAEAKEKLKKLTPPLF